MTYAPATLSQLGKYWSDHGGVNLGIVGNQKHCAGYHLGKDRIFSDCACKPDGTCESGKRWSDYSVQTSRDKAGLTNGSAAIDLGKLNGTLVQLRQFSDWLARRCVKSVAGTEDVREVIYSPDGKRVLGFKDGVDFLIPDYGDLSHLTHTHVSFYRDAEARDKRPLFAPYFTVPDTDTEEVVLDYTHIDGQADSGPGTVTVTIDGAAAILVDGTLYGLPKGSVKHSYGLIRFKDGTWKGQDAYLIGQDCGYLLKRAVTYKADAVVDCTDAVAVQREKDRTASLAAIEEVFAA